MKKVFFSLLLFIMGFVSAQQTIIPEFEVGLDKQYYQASDKVVLTVTLKNYNNDKWTMENVKVSVESNAIISYEPLTQGPVAIDMNEAKTFTFKVRLKNLPNGSYDVTVRYTSQYLCGGTPVRPQDEKRTIAIHIDNSEPSLSLFKVEYVVEEGEPFNLVFINEGLIAKNASFEISSDASFDYKGFLGYITNTASAPVKIKEKPGSYKAYVNLTYFNKLGQERKISVPINIKVIEKKTEESKAPPKIVASLMNPDRKATFADYLPYYALGLFLIILFSSLLAIVARLL